MNFLNDLVYKLGNLLLCSCSVFLFLRLLKIWNLVVLVDVSIECIIMDVVCLMFILVVVCKEMLVFLDWEEILEGRVVFKVVMENVEVIVMVMMG